MREAYPILSTLLRGVKVLEDVDELEMEAHNKGTDHPAFQEKGIVEMVKAQEDNRVDVERASESISKVAMPNIRLMVKQHKVKPPVGVYSTCEFILVHFCE
jgi:hypothetical protein